MNATALATNWEGFVPSPPLATAALPDIEGVDILTLSQGTPDELQTLLGERFLCRGGTLLFVGPSGVGKSSASMAQDILWSLGRDAFGIKPARPLRILTIQAENDDGDLIEMAKGTLSHLTDSLDETDRAMIRENTRYVTACSLTGTEFLTKILEPAIIAHRPDLVRIDPLFAYVGCKIEDTVGMGNFLRGGLHPILQGHNCACILAHHTPKPQKSNGRPVERTTLDYAYFGAGAAELTNYCRAVLALDATGDPHVFKFIAAKRGARIGWRDPFGTREYVRHFAHGRQDGGIYWREADAAETESATAKPGRDVEAELTKRVPVTAPIGKNELIQLTNKQTGIGMGRLKSALCVLLEADPPRLFEWREKRSGTNHKILIATSPQPSADAEEVESGDANVESAKRAHKSPNTRRPV